jgi:hypothetical protein
MKKDQRNIHVYIEEIEPSRSENMSAQNESKASQQLTLANYDSAG